MRSSLAFVTAPVSAAAAIFLASTLLPGLLGDGAAEAHALWVTPAPRDQQDGYKDPPRAPPGTGAPCGISRAVPPQPEAKNLQPGQALHVEWTETVTHPGCFVVDFAAADDANFQILGVKSHAGAAGGTPRSWNLDVVLPSVTCATCTLRLRQLMLGTDVTEAQCPPNPIPAGATYYSCANVALGSGDPGTGAGGAGTTGGPAASGDPGGGCSCAVTHGGVARPGTRPWAALIVVGISLALTITRRRSQNRSRRMRC